MSRFLASRHFLIAGALVFSTTATALGDASSSAFLMFSETGRNTPQYSVWNGSSWSSDVDMPSVGSEPKWVMAANCPTRNETAFASLDYNKDVNLLIHNGVSWGSAAEICSNAGTHDDRPLSLAYEQLSGDLLIAYWNDSSNKIGVRTFNGTTLSSETLLTLPASANVKWLSLTAQGGSDEIMLVAVNGDEDLFAASWSGSAWGAVATLHTDLETSGNESFAFAYETGSGDGLVAYGRRNQRTPGYRTWNGAAWSSEALAPSVGADPRWLRLVPDPASDVILFGSLDASKDINVNVWNGSAWGTNRELENDADGTNRRLFDIAFENGGVEALIAYAENGEDHLHYRTWNGSVWSSEQSGPGLGDVPQVVRLATGTQGGEIFVLASDQSDDLNFMRWNGTSLSGTTQIESGLGGVNSTEQFAISVPGEQALVPANTPYANDFESAMGAEWSDATRTSNGTYTNFAGRHWTEALNLALNTTVGETYSVVFDLYTIDSWEGSHSTYGPDSFTVSAGGTTVFSHTFVHGYPSYGQTYPYPYDQIGAYGFNSSCQDGVYRRVEAVFTATAATTIVTFQGLFNDDTPGIDNESWGIDNLTVKASRFRNVSVAQNFKTTTSTSADNYGGSIHWADVDNDGDLDAILTGGSARKMRNDLGSFRPIVFGRGDVRRSGAIVDLDHDGDLDFWAAAVSGYNDERFFRNSGTGGFSNRGNLGFGNPTNNEALAAADVNGDGWCDLVMLSGNNGNWIGHNQGGSPPVLVGTNAASYGLNDSGDTGNGDYCSAGDVNNDKYPDFFYHYGGGKLFVSDGDGTYTENPFGLSVTTGDSAKFGSAWGDYDNDGDLDLFCARVAETCTGYLWRNDRDWSAGTGTFTNRTSTAGFNLNTTINYTPDLPGSRSAAWGDYDNDGDLDLFIAGAAGANYFYTNQGDGTFARNGEGVVVSGTLIDASFVDFDNDGDLDLCVTRQSANTVLFENRTNSLNYLKVRLVGLGAGKTNLAAIGTRVELWNAAGTALLARRDVGVARGYGSTEPTWLHFGGVTPASTYQVKAYFMSGTVTESVVPANVSTTIGSRTINQMATIGEPAGAKIIKWNEVVNKAL